MAQLHCDDHRAARPQPGSLTACDESWPPGWGLVGAFAFSGGAWTILITAVTACARALFP